MHDSGLEACVILLLAAIHFLLCTRSRETRVRKMTQDNVSLPNATSSWSNDKDGTLSYSFTLPLIPYLGCSPSYNNTETVFPPLFCLLSLIGTLGNLCSLWTSMKPSQSWSTGTVGVLNLALCDLAYLVSIPLWAVYVGANYHWCLGRSLCILFNVLSFVGLTSSTMFICAISIDRFLAIVFPLESRMIRTPRNATLISVLLWAITALLTYLSYPNVLYWVGKDGRTYCGTLVISKFKFPGTAYDLLSYYSVQVSVPLLLIIPSYVKIVARLRQSRQQWGLGHLPGRNKTTRLIAVFIVNFLVCWVPGQLLHIVACVVFLVAYHSANPCSVAQVINLLVETSQVLYLINACLDTLIFHVLQCQAALGWLACLRKRRKGRQVEEEKRASAGKAVSVVQPPARGQNENFPE